MKTISDIYRSGVHDDRRASYPLFDREAKAECTILGALRTLASSKPRHVFLRRLIMKIIREWHSPKLDNLIDIIGYVECHYERFGDLYEEPPLSSPLPQLTVKQTTTADNVCQYYGIVPDFPYPSPPVRLTGYDLLKDAPINTEAVYEGHDKVRVGNKHLLSFKQYREHLKAYGVTEHASEFIRCSDEIRRYRNWCASVDNPHTKPRHRAIRIVGKSFDETFVRSDPRISSTLKGFREARVSNIESLIVQHGAGIYTEDTVLEDPTENSINGFWLWAATIDKPTPDRIWLNNNTRISNLWHVLVNDDTHQPVVECNHLADICTYEEFNQYVREHGLVLAPL